MHLHFCRATKGSRCLWKWFLLVAEPFFGIESCLWAQPRGHVRYFLLSYQRYIDHTVDIIFRKLYIYVYIVVFHCEIAPRYLPVECLLRFAIEIESSCDLFSVRLITLFTFYLVFYFHSNCFRQFSSHFPRMARRSFAPVLTWMILWLANDKVARKKKMPLGC